MTKLGDFVAARRAELGLTQEQLAQAAGLSDAAIGKIERGETRKPNNIRGLARALNVLEAELGGLITGYEERRGFRKPAFDFSVMASLPRKMELADYLEQFPEYDPAHIPVLGTAHGSLKGSALGMNQAIEIIPRPPNLEGIRRAYAVYVQGESMVPRYFPGELVCVNPNKPVGRGDFCVVQLKKAGEEVPDEAYIKQFVGITGNDGEAPHETWKYHFSQFNPERSVDWSGERVFAIHRIVGTQS